MLFSVVNLLLYKGNACMHTKSPQSCLTLCTSMDCSSPGSSVHGDSPGKNTRVGCHALFQWIFTTQGLNPGLWHCRQFLYYLSHQESPRILEWVSYPFSRGSSWTRNQTRVFCFAGGFFTSWATKEAPNVHSSTITIAKTREQPKCPSIGD